MDLYDEPLADCGRDAVAGDAQVRSHVGPVHVGQQQRLVIVLTDDCNTRQHLLSVRVCVNFV